MTTTFAQDLGPATVSNAHRFSLASNYVDQTFVIDVALPTGPLAEGQELPVIYVVDGNWTFPLAAQVARGLQAGPFPLPKAIVVGIGYPYDTPAQQIRTMHLRTRDLAPSADEVQLARIKAAPAPFTFPDDLQMGQARQFLDFIEEELKPFIAGRFPVDRTDQTLAGMSLGGLFVLYALFARPRAFDRYLALSPAVYWDNGALFAQESECAANSLELPAKVFMSVGALEEAHDADCRFVSNLYAMEAQIRRRAYRNLDLTFKVFEDETHMSVFPAALSRGLVTVFGGHGDIYDCADRVYVRPDAA